MELTNFEKKKMIPLTKSIHNQQICHICKKVQT